MTDIHPTRLYLIRLGGGDIPSEPPVSMSFASYLIQMSDGRNLLIDTGFPPDWDLSDRFPTIRFDHTIVSALAELGLQPNDIHILITTHFDPDHAGMNDAFPGAEMVAQRAGYEEARNGQQRAALTREHWDAPDLRYRLVDGDTELLPGVTLISSPGHAPGHQSILVRLPNAGAVLLAIDAVAQASAFRPDREPAPMDLDGAEAIQSTIKLLALVEREQVALVVHGHDGAQWAGLRTAPEFYD
jgi:N-acyl homoserine lactone hydrolase